MTQSAFAFAFSGWKPRSATGLPIMEAKSCMSQVRTHSSFLSLKQLTPGVVEAYSWTNVQLCAVNTFAHHPFH